MQLFELPGVRLDGDKWPVQLVAHACGRREQRINLIGHRADHVVDLRNIADLLEQLGRVLGHLRVELPIESADAGREFVQRRCEATGRVESGVDVGRNRERRIRELRERGCVVRCVVSGRGVGTGEFERHVVAAAH